MTTLTSAASRKRSMTTLQVAATTAIWTLALVAGDPSTTWTFAWAILAGSVTTLLLLRRSRVHRLIRSFTEDINDVVVTSLLGAGTTMAIASAADRSLRLVPVAVAATASIVALLLIRSLAARSQLMQRNGERVVVIGTGEEGAELAQLVAEHPEASLELIGVVGNCAMADRHGLTELLLGDVDDLESIFDAHAIGTAIVTPTSFRSRQYRRIMAAAEHAGVTVHLSSGVARVAAPRFQVSSLVHEPFVSVRWDQPSRGQQAARRIIDVVGASVALVLASPVMLLAALAVKLHDRGPVLYRSERIGQNNRPFGMIKFRSMRPNADEQKVELAQRNERSGPLFKLSNDPRVTPVGRFLRETSIDELPQLINVLRGEMSLVGPRPALPEEFERFDDELKARFTVRPGITGLWQVEARSNAEFGAYRRLDLHYVANWSLLLDLQILVATAVQIVTSLLLLPISLLTRRGINDQIAHQPAAPVIDLRSASSSTDRPTDSASSEPRSTFSAGS